MATSNSTPSDSAPQGESTKAPSEKHLEDWIVQYPRLTYPDYWGIEPNKSSLIEVVLARQPKFPVGTPDLIIQTPDGVAVVEIKKDSIDDSTVVQCLRYMAYLEHISMSSHYALSNQLLPEDRQYLEYGFQSNLVSGFLIGHSIKSDNLLHACWLLNLYPILYRFEGDGYAFYSQRVDIADPNGESADWASGAIGQAMRTTMLKRANRLKKRALAKSEGDK